jgi:hypothetical protein
LAQDGPEVVAILAEPLRGCRSFGKKLVGASPITTPRSHHRAGLQQGAIDRQLGGRCTAESWLQRGQHGDRYLLGLVVAAHC